ncbi:conserved hypothetical protein [Arthrobacter sp. 9AX]|uniref:hypothetical protein n=1 Tax=Arthrobacter sp. 9AX TaxID=2653131 RepID=UPI0012F04617|nr:hypothetical protein [Arthrobacter sp. 9AX]VXC14698.1 conserved hypothetical protein [Arthrobacter sp. 9AX]
MNSPALKLLHQGAVALAPGFQPSGELNDPVFHEPTQYGTPYYAYVSAVLASTAADDQTAVWADRAKRGLEATLKHLLDDNDPHPAAADYTHGVGSPSFRNLRDFMWPPVMRTYRLLKELGTPGLQDIEDKIRAVDVPRAFSEMPPVNWAAVWILGEWQRIKEGMSPHSILDIDAWLEPFFSENADVDHGFYRELREATGVEIDWTSAIDLENGFYREPGVPNSYDMWCRVHLLELLVEGYDGVYEKDLRILLSSGTKRSLGVQLSSGSLASAYRSTAHLWNLTGQTWYFHHAGLLLADSEPELAAEATAASLRSFAAAQACLRQDGSLSPVENAFPANWRIGHEVYTMDAHYVSLPLGYLATAVLEGFTGSGTPENNKTTRTHVEESPVYRSLIHGEDWSVHVNLAPFPGYDPLGIADITTGVGRRLRFGGQTHYGRPDGDPEAHRLSNQTPFTLGVGYRTDNGSIHPVSAMKPTQERSFESDGTSLTGTAKVAAEIRTYWTGGESEAVLFDYQINLSLADDSVIVEEGIGDHPHSLFIPYLRDRGDGFQTEVEIHGSEVTLTSGDEVLRITADRPTEKAVHLAHGYESRHGLVGLVRLDLQGRGAVNYKISRLR